MTAAGLSVALSLAPAVFGGATLLVGTEWLPSIGFNLTLRLDGLGMLFALLILGIGLLVILYAHYYLTPEDATGRFCHGDAPGLADLCLVPQIYNAQRFHCPTVAYPKAMRIFETCRALPAFAEAWPEAVAG